MRRLFAVAFLVAAFPVIAGDDFQEWRKHTSKEGEFSIAFPDTPISKGPAVFFRKDDGKPFWLVAAWQSLDMKLDDKKVASDFLQGGQHGILDSSKGKLFKESTWEFESRPAREFSFQSERYGFVRTRLLLSANKVYILSFYGETEALLKSKSAQHYFRSFKLAK